MPSCAIITCRKRSQACSVAREGISFHRFPTDPDLRKLWIEATGRIEWIPTKCSTICSKHFAENDYIKKKAGNRFLKPGATPHKNFGSLLASTSDIVTQAAFTSDTVTQTASTSDLTHAASTVDEITSQNTQTSLSPTNALTPRKAKLAIINTKESLIIKRKRLQIKRIQAQNRRLKRKNNKIEGILNNIKENFCLKNEDTNIQKNINLQFQDSSRGIEIKVFCPKCKTKVSHTAEGIQEDQTKILVAKVYHYFEQEYEELKKMYGDLDLTPLSNFDQRTVLATGVSETTLLQILKEEEGRNANKRRKRSQKRRAALKRRRQTDSSSQEDRPDDNAEEIEQPSCVDEVQTLVVKMEPPEYTHEEPEIFLQTEVKLEPADGVISKEHTDPISVDVKIEPRDAEADTTSETLAHNEPAATKRTGNKISRKTDDTSTRCFGEGKHREETSMPERYFSTACKAKSEAHGRHKNSKTRQHTPGGSSASVASSSAPLTETLNESGLSGGRELKIEIHEEGFS